MEHIGDRIKKKREEHGLTMEDLGNKLGVTKSTISKWERGDVDNIKRSYIPKLAEILNVDPAWLMGFSPDDRVTVVYNAEGKTPFTAIVDQKPIIGESSKRAELYKVALDIKPENIDIAIQILKSLI